MKTNLLKNTYFLKIFASSVYILFFILHISVANAQMPLPTVSFSVNRTQISKGESVTLTWSSSGAYTCTSSGNWIGNRGTSGTYTVKPPSSAVYTLRCWNTEGKYTSNSVSVLVQALQVPQVTISANPTSIKRGESSMIRWSSTYADICVASGGWSGTRSTSGSISVTPTHYSGYTIICSNSLYRIRKSVNISVFSTLNGTDGNSGSTSGAIDVVITAIPQTIAPGQSSKLNWGATNVNNCYASGAWSGSKSSYGTQIVAPSTSSNYVLTCSKGADLKTVTATVIVDSNFQGSVTPTPTPNSTPIANRPTLLFRANPTTVYSGSAAVLSWQSGNAASCVAGGGWTGTKLLSGNFYVWPTAQTNYVLTCYGPNGSVTASALITVIKPTQTPLPSPTKTTSGSTFGTSSVNTTGNNSSFNASCNANYTSVRVGDQVLWRASAQGGVPPYSYIWSGAFSGTDTSTEISFSTTGNKSEMVIVSDKLGRTARATCSVNVEPNNVDSISSNEPIGEVLSLERACALKTVLVCDDGNIYKYNNGAESVLTRNNDYNNIQSVQDTGATTSSSIINNKSYLASILKNEDGKLSGFGFVIIAYVAILTVVLLVVASYRLLKSKSASQL